jgi:peptidoglycan/xylan/chitin deacetylase (PgdA/CDA1 family)
LTVEEDLPVNVVALMYHDVTAAGREDASGFPGGESAHYKLTPSQFDDHLQALRHRAGVRPATIQVLEAQQHDRSLLLTFDDGGASATAIADSLDALGWKGHFFVTTAYVGRPGFLAAREIRELRARGHLVGSHTCTHPLRMARCSTHRLFEEWSRSLAALGDILGERVTIASVPGGDHSNAVADQAAAAGVRILFTSRPTARVQRRGGLLVVGRFVVRRSTTADVAASVAAGALAPRWAQLLAWDATRFVKAVAGPAYRRLRERRLGSSERVRWGDDLASASEDPS